MGELVKYDPDYANLGNFQTIASALTESEDVREMLKRKDMAITAMQRVVGQFKDIDPGALAIIKENPGYVRTALTGLAKMRDDMSKCESKSDVARLMDGLGYQKATYGRYLTAFDQFCEFNGRKLPDEIEPVDIDRYFEWMQTKAGGRLTAKTIQGRMQGLKNYLAMLEDVYPGFISPFSPTRMPKKMLNKIWMRQGKAHRKLPLPTLKESTDFLNWLHAGNCGILNANHITLPPVVENRLLTSVMVLCFSGIRISELVYLRYGNLKQDDDGAWWITEYRAKPGVLIDKKWIHPRAVAQVNDYLVKVLHRKPYEDDFLLYQYYPQIKNLTEPKPVTHRAIIERDFQYSVIRARQLGIVKSVERFVPHDLKAVGVSLLLAAGWTQQQVQEFTKHANPAMIANYYDRRDAGKRMPDPTEVFDQLITW